MSHTLPKSVESLKLVLELLLDLRASMLCFQGGVIHRPSSAKFVRFTAKLLDAPEDTDGKDVH